MKDRPILMTPENAQKCHEGQKTMTRRILKPQPEEGATIKGPEWYAPCAYDKDGQMYPGDEVFGVYSEDGDWGVRCPYGTLGSKLWVREAMTVMDGQVYYKGNYYPGLSPHLFYRPSINMPKKYCRTWLELTEVRVERVQDISEEDAKAEGCQASTSVTMKDGSPCYTLPFQNLWTSIHGIDNPKSWEANPWVWCLTFKRITP